MLVVYGMASRKADAIMMRIAEVIYSIPYLLVVILLSVVFTKAGSGSSMFVMILAMTLTSWVPMAILVRGQVLQLKESEYALASESLGGSKSWILKKHIIPNTLGPILVNVTLPRAIFYESPSTGNPQNSGKLANDGLAGLLLGYELQRQLMWKKYL